MRAEALNRAAQILENPEYQGVVLRRDKDGGPIDTGINEEGIC